MYTIGWFSTGRGQGSLNLLHAIVKAMEDGTVPAKLGFVFCSREEGDAEGSDRYIRQAKEYGLNIVCFSSKRFKPELRKEGKQNPDALHQWRIEYDREIMKRIDGLDARLCVLAGYMLITGPELCTTYDMVNLHPAAPNGPAGTWQEVIWQLIEEQARESGNMMHLVTEELDKGPPITYSLFPIRGSGYDFLWEEMAAKLTAKTLEQISREEGEENSLFKKIREDGALREIPLVVQTVKSFAEGRVKLENRRIIADGKVLSGPYCLTDDIEKVIE